MAATQNDRNIRISSPLGADVLLFHRMSGHDGLSELGEYHLDLLSEKSDLKIDDVLGHALTVKIDVSAQVVREFSGIVTRFVMTGRAGRYAAYQATVRPWLWFLTRSADCRIFQDKDAVAIIKEIFEKYALADFDLTQLSATPPVLPYCVQYRETDFAFVSRLMERFGIYYFFKHDGGRHTLVLADSAAAHTAILGKKSLQFYADGDTRARPNETVYSWQAGGEILSDAYTLQAYNFETPTVDLTAKSTREHAYQASARTLEVYDYPGAYLERTPGEGEAKTRLESIQAGYQTVNAAGTVAAVAPGGLFNLTEHPRADQNGEMLAVSARYQLYSDAFEAEAGVRPSDKKDAPPPFDCQFSAIPKSATFRSPRATPRPLMQGPQTAIVVGKSGEEIWTDKYGRIRIKFHWDRLGDPEQDADACSCWVRVAQAWAGKRFGQLFIPRIGQEVVVSFLEGDPDQPLVTGSVYNAQNMPPVTLPDQASRSTIKTNTTKGGEGFNEIRFEDKKDAEEIFVQAEKDYNRVVKNNDTLKVGFEKKDKGNQTIAIHNDQSLEVGNDRTVHVKHDQTATIDNNLTTTVKKDATHTIENNLSTTVKNNETRSVTKDQTVDVNGNQKVKAGQTIVVEAGTSMELKVGASSIKIEPAKITLKSAQIAVEADGMMTLKAGGIVTIEGSLVKLN
jgi:type VI secretion system secreted protein VgrG